MKLCALLVVAPCLALVVTGHAEAQAVAPAKPGVQVAFLAATVSDSALGDVGLVESGVSGLAVPADRESLAMLSFRLLTLQERKLARVIATPAMLVEAATDARLDVEPLGRLRVTTRTAGETTMLDVTGEAPRWLQAGVARGTSPLGTWALLGPATERGQTFVLLVSAREEEPEPPAAEAAPVAADAEAATRSRSNTLGR